MDDRREATSSEIFDAVLFQECRQLDIAKHREFWIRFPSVLPALGVSA